VPFNPGLCTQIGAPTHPWVRAGIEYSLGDRLEAYPTLRASGVSSDAFQAVGCVAGVVIVICRRFVYNEATRRFDTLFSRREMMKSCCPAGTKYILPAEASLIFGTVFRPEGAGEFSPGFQPWEPYPLRRALKGLQIECGHSTPLANNELSPLQGESP
jgi:hypothetical protein